VDQCSRLVEMANMLGGRDNITALIMRVGSNDSTPECSSAGESKSLAETALDSACGTPSTMTEEVPS